MGKIDQTPSIFPNIPSSVIPTQLLKPRYTTKVLSSIRNEKCDELSQYLKSDLFTFISLCEDIKNHKFVCPVTTFLINEILLIQSNSFYVNRIPMFAVHISSNFKFESFHAGVGCSISSLPKNHIKTLDFWSRVEETIRYLNNIEVDYQRLILKDHIASMNASEVGKKIYNIETIIRSYSYFSTS